MFTAVWTLALAQALAPEQHFVTAPTSTLCKVVAWDANGVLRKVKQGRRLTPNFSFVMCWNVFPAQLCRITDRLTRATRGTYVGHGCLDGSHVKPRRLNINIF